MHTIKRPKIGLFFELEKKKEKKGKKHLLFHLN